MLVLRPLIRYADFKGRARRGEYFGFTLFQALLQGLLIGLAGAMAGEDTAGQTGALGLFAVSGVITVAFIIPNYAVLTRRIHDIDKSGWWVVALMSPTWLAAIMIMGALASVVQAAAANVDAEQAVPAFLAAIGGAGIFGLIGMISTFVLFIMTLLPGTDGENRFGPDPRDGSGFGNYQPVGSKSLFSDDRLDELVEEAKRERSGGDDYKPIFDFGPEPAQTQPIQRVVETPQQTWVNPAYDRGIAPSRPFGRRT